MSSQYHPTSPREPPMDNNNSRMSKSPSANFGLLHNPMNQQGFQTGYQQNMYQNYGMNLNDPNHSPHGLTMNDPNRSPHGLNTHQPNHFKHFINFKENNQNVAVSSEERHVTLAQTNFETSHTNTTANRFPGTSPGDTMLSDINYNADMLPDTNFDVDVTVSSNLPNLDAEGILVTMANTARDIQNPGAPSFDLFEEGQENYIEPQSELTISPRAYSDTGQRFALPEPQNLSIGGANSDSGDGISDSIPSAPPKPRGKGRPRTSGSPGRTSAQCQQCGKTFSNSSALAKHKLTHSDERKYVCQLCSKAFKRQDHLNGHMMTHRAKKPYECKFEGCEKSYCDARSLRRHLENHHNQPPDVASAGVAAAQSMPPPPPPQVFGQNGDGSRIQYAPPPPYNASPHTSPSFNTGGNQQGQFFQFDVPYHGNQDNPNPSSWQQDYRMNQYGQSMSGETSPGYQQQFSPISPAPGTHPTSPMPHPGQRGQWMGFQNPVMEPNPVECSICQRKFKNIPALNGHMRLHGGYFKKDTGKDKSSENGQQTQKQQESRQQYQPAASNSSLSALKERLKSPDPEFINSIASTLSAMSQGEIPHSFTPRLSSFVSPPNHMSGAQVSIKNSPPELKLDDFNSHIDSLSGGRLISGGKPSDGKPYMTDKPLLGGKPLDSVGDGRRVVTNVSSVKPVPNTSKNSFTPISVAATTTATRIYNGAHYVPVARSGKPANYWRKEKYNPDLSKSKSVGQAFTFSPEDTIRSKELLAKKDSKLVQMNVSSPVTSASDRKRHASADHDNFTSRSSLTSPGSLSNFLTESSTDPLHPIGRRRRDSEKLYSKSPRLERSSSIEGVLTRPRSQADGVFREPYRPISRGEDMYTRSDGAIFFRTQSLSNVRGKRKHRPEPLIIPPHMNNCGFQSRLRSPRLWEGGEPHRGHTPPPYTPPPMLSPVRSGSGLFWHLQSLRPITPSGPVTPRMSLSRRSSLRESLSEKAFEELIVKPEESIEEQPGAEAEVQDEPPPETDVQPHVNIGPQYQAVPPPLCDNKELAIFVPSPEVLLWQPEIVKELNEEDVQYFQDFACSAAIRGNGMNKEYALHLLYRHKGNITDSMLDVMNKMPEVTKSDCLTTYKYNESGTWTTEDIEAYTNALFKHDKDFFKISNQIGSKTTKDCVEFYYVWKKCCPDEYKRSRILRRRREQDELYNLRQRTAQQEQVKIEFESESESSQSDNESDCNSESSSVSATGSIASSSINVFVCEHPNCNMSFQSRQALSGHIRIHSKTNNDKKEKAEKKTKPPPPPIGSEEFPCKLCTKVFYKVKSRNAHMKSHRQQEEKARQAKLQKANAGDTERM